MGVVNHLMLRITTDERMADYYKLLWHDQLVLTSCSPSDARRRWGKVSTPIPTFDRTSAYETGASVVVFTFRSSTRTHSP